jgi:hypothetical protein
MPPSIGIAIAQYSNHSEASCWLVRANRFFVSGAAYAHKNPACNSTYAFTAGETRIRIKAVCGYYIRDVPVGKAKNARKKAGMGFPCACLNQSV